MCTRAEASFDGSRSDPRSIRIQDLSMIDSRYFVVTNMNMIFTFQVTILHEHDNHILDYS